MAQTGEPDVPLRKTRDRRLRRLLARSRHIGFTPRVMLRRMIFWIGALAVGLCAIGFAAGANHANHLYHQLIAITRFAPFIVAPAGLALVAWLTRRFFPGSQGSGIPQAIAALQMRDEGQRRSVLSLKLAFGKIVLTLLGLLAGASVGREGPTVQVGASIMLTLGKWVRFPRIELERGLILAGGAAGIAAAFNTPLAGVMFAIEEMSRSFEERTSGTVLTAVIVAGLLS
ncbi:MAG TPA: chloride channel protein, partial [Acetobacteraceae bacterium]|nr:chloride channel protein [Acetobacteraceae bacterium]